MERGARLLLLMIAILLWGLVGYDYYHSGWQTPLGPRLDLPGQISPAQTTSAFPAPSSLPAVTSAPSATLLPGQQTPFPEIPSFPAAPRCNGPDTLLILAVGSDSRGSGYLYGLGDVIRLVRVDFTLPRLTVLEIPRDIWVEIPELDPKFGIDHGKLNQAYLYGNKGMGYYSGPGEGPGLLARTLDLNFGARPDNYLAANMQTFVRLVDAIGGVDVVLPNSVDGRKADQSSRTDLYFEAGSHHLNGQQALTLARLRQLSTFERADNQNLVLCAVRKSLLTPSNLPKLPEIIAAFDGAIQTDLSPQQISQLACLLPQLQAQNINFVTFPLETLRATRTYDKGVQKDVYIFQADFETLRAYVNAFTLGQWPAPLPALPITLTPGKTSRGETFTCP
jgi:LCP family protein required for cell wall assembly